MRLTSKKLKNLIMEVLQEEGKKERIMKMLRGQNPDVQTVGIMSGQNPNASSLGAGPNDRLQAGLESDLRSMGYQFERIGGVFEGLSEKSVIIKNPSLQDMDELNRKYGQWGFVFGRRKFEPTRDDSGALQRDMGPDASPSIAGEYAMEFQMYKIRDEEDAGFDQAEWSSKTTDVMSGDETAGLEDNYSVIPGMGDQGKILIPLYGRPEVPMSDDDIEGILSSLGSPSQFSGYRGRRS